MQSQVAFFSLGTLAFAFGMASCGTDFGGNKAAKRGGEALPPAAGTQGANDTNPTLTPTGSATVGVTTMPTAVASAAATLPPVVDASPTFTALPIGQPTEQPIDQTIEASFDSLNTLLMAPKCASCHSGVSPAGKIDLSSYDALRQARTFPPLVVPLDAKGSLIVKAVEQGNMPLGAPKLSAIEISALKAWINSGARRNETDPVPTPLPTASEPPD